MLFGARPARRLAEMNPSMSRGSMRFSDLLPKNGAK